MQEVNLLSERPEIFRGMVEDKIRIQSRARRTKTEADSQDLSLLSVMQVIGGGSRRRDESGVSEKDSGRTSGDE